MSDLLTFDPHFVRTCSFATMHTPGYGTRVTLFNGVRAGEEFATPFVVSMSAFDDQGTLLARSAPITELAPGGMEKIDVDEILRTMAPDGNELRDVLGVLHLIPERWVGRDECEVSREELLAHTFATDDFIEYYSYDGNVITGVAYQTGPMNDARLSSTRSTTIQAPKVIVSDRVDTIFLLMNVSTSFDYDGDVTLRFRVVGPSGQRIAAGSVTVPAFSFRLLSIREVLQRAGAADALADAGGLATFYGLSQNGTVVPLSMTRNDATGAIAVDHTLPPLYYVNKWSSDLRKQGNARLAELMFAEVPEEVTIG